MLDRFEDFPFNLSGLRGLWVSGGDAGKKGLLILSALLGIQSVIVQMFMVLFVGPDFRHFELDDESYERVLRGIAVFCLICLPRRCAELACTLSELRYF
jgi:hypothetical protein